MRHLIPLLLGLTVWGCQQPEASAEPSSQPSEAGVASQTEPSSSQDKPTWLTTTPVGCQVQVIFGSYGSGADQTLRLRVLQMLDNDPGVVETTNTPWGREGESTVCVRTVDTKAANRIYDAVMPIIPATSARSWSAIAHTDGRNRRTEWTAEGN